MSSYVYVFAFDYATAQRGTAATPRRFGYGDMSSPVLYGMGLVSTADSPDPDLQTSFPPPMYVNVDNLQTGCQADHLYVGLRPQLTAAAGTTLPTPTALIGPLTSSLTSAHHWGGGAAAEAPGGRRRRLCGPSSASTFHI